MIQKWVVKQPQAPLKPQVSALSVSTSNVENHQTQFVNNDRWNVVKNRRYPIKDTQIDPIDNPLCVNDSLNSVCNKEMDSNSSDLLKSLILVL